MQSVSRTTHTRWPGRNAPPGREQDHHYSPNARLIAPSCASLHATFQFTACMRSPLFWPCPNDDVHTVTVHGTDVPSATLHTTPPFTAFAVDTAPLAVPAFTAPPHLLLTVYACTAPDEAIIHSADFHSASSQHLQRTHSRRPPPVVHSACIHSASGDVGVSNSAQASSPSSDTGSCAPGPGAAGVAKGGTADGADGGNDTGAAGHGCGERRPDSERRGLTCAAGIAAAAGCGPPAARSARVGVPPAASALYAGIADAV